MENCKGVADDVDGVIQGFKEFDVEAAQKSESE